MGFIGSILSLLSGNGGSGNVHLSEQLLFDKVIGFRGVCDGAGASTLIQNIAAQLSYETRYKICVLDTNMLYPCQATLLGAVDMNNDILDFDRGMDLGKIVWATNYPHVYTVGFRNRTIIDLVAVTENMEACDKLIFELKSMYDIILVDLSHEPSNFATAAAIKCNKIFVVSDTSMKNTGNLVNSMNYLLTLGVSLSKCKNIILNKTTHLNSGIKEVTDSLGLQIFVEIPFSKLIYQQGISGKPFYGMPTHDKDITMAHLALQAICNDILEITPNNDKNIKKDNKKKGKKGIHEQSASIVEEQAEDGVHNEQIDFDDDVQTSAVIDQPQPQSSVELLEKNVNNSDTDGSDEDFEPEFTEGV